jgi:hypothetical protein
MDTMGQGRRILGAEGGVSPSFCRSFQKNGWRAYAGGAEAVERFTDSPGSVTSGDSGVGGN